MPTTPKQTDQHVEYAKKLVTDKALRFRVLSAQTADTSKTFQKQKLYRNYTFTPPDTVFGHNRYTILDTFDCTNDSFQSTKPCYSKRTNHRSPKQFVKTKRRKLQINNTNSSQLNQVCGSKPLVELSLFDRKIHALLDTGSQVNVISQDKLPNDVLLNLDPAPCSIVSYTGNEIDIIGIFSAPILIEEIQLNNCFFYVTAQKRQTILGTPAIESNKISINISKSVISQGSKTAPISKTKLTTDTASQLFTIEKRHNPPIQLECQATVTLPAKSEKFIKLHARHPIAKVGYTPPMGLFRTNFLEVF